MAIPSAITLVSADTPIAIAFVANACAEFPNATLLLPVASVPLPIETDRDPDATDDVTIAIVSA